MDVFATTGEKNLFLRGIEMVIWNWKNDEGHLHIKKFNNALYFMDPPVNNTIATVLDKSPNDEKWKWLPTKQK